MEACGVIDRELDENSKIAAFSGLAFNIFKFLLWSKEKFSEDSDDEILLKLFRKGLKNLYP